MSRTLVVGDMHLKQRLVLPIVDRALEKYAISRVVFCGDYVDEWMCTDGEELDALDVQLTWVRARNLAGLSTIHLLGNHDWNYIEGSPAYYTHAGVLAEVAERLLLLELRPAVAVGGWLVSHAGLTHRWSLVHAIPHSDAAEAADALNALASTGLGMRALYSCGPARGGWDVPGPLWADVLELAGDPEDGLRQIVGHTPVRTCSSIKTHSGAERVMAADAFSLTSSLGAFGDASMVVVEDDTGEVEVIQAFEDGESWNLAVRDWRSSRGA